MPYLTVANKPLRRVSTVRRSLLLGRLYFSRRKKLRVVSYRALRVRAHFVVVVRCRVALRETTTLFRQSGLPVNSLGIRGALLLRVVKDSILAGLATRWQARPSLVTVLLRARSRDSLQVLTGDLVSLIRAVYRSN